MMQRKSTTHLVLFLAVVAIGCAIVMAQESEPQQTNDPVLSFYWKRADASLTSRDPLQHGLHYSFVATSYYRKIGKAGRVESTDSSKTRYYYSYGQLDSSKVVLQPKREMPPTVFEFPNVFNEPYHLVDFPNDTGGQTLAIGFDADSLVEQTPTGLAVIDRQLYYPHWLYLYFPYKEGYRRFTRSYRFILQDGFVFPDSVWEVATRNLLFSVATYRLDTRVDSLTIHR